MLFSPVRIIAVTLALMAMSGCAAFTLAGYAVWPDYPTFDEQGEATLAGLRAGVGVSQTPDGLWHIEAENEHDLMFMTGYLQARDRLAQMDIFRHLAQGRISELVGIVPFGGKSSLDVDRYNRFLGFHAAGERLLANASPEERAAVEAFAAGINAWLASGSLPLEHRLMGVESIAPWQPADSMSIYQMLMFGLSSNANREIRRLVIACALDVSAAERIWPSNIDFGVTALPPDAIRAEKYAIPPHVVPEIAAELPALCAPSGDLTHRSPPSGGLGGARAYSPIAALVPLSSGFSASNNWVVAGRFTASGKPIFANDPHLPHMNPPIVWGVVQGAPAYRTAGFTLPGLHRVVFGHNGYVAWGATTNHVDRQDLVVHRPAAFDRHGKATAYELDGEAVPFEVRAETFRVHGEEESRTFTARFSVDGPLLNDIESGLPGAIPLTALRMVTEGTGGDIEAARGLAFAKNATEFVTAIRGMDLGCTNWVYADIHGDIGYESPCRLPVREGWSGAFPVPGWSSRYHWTGVVPKTELPRSRNPRQGWIATANSRIVAQDRFPTAYNSDPSEPHRYQRAAAIIESHIAEERRFTVESSTAMQLDTKDHTWPELRPLLEAPICSQSPAHQLAQALRRELCGWDGDMRSDSSAATIFVLFTNALLDRALADELPGGAAGELWRYVQDVPMFEANAQWLWKRGADDPVWDDARTAEKESRDSIFSAAFADAVAAGRERFGGDPEDWQWGRIRAFRTRHLFANQDGLLGGMLNSAEFPFAGAPTTLFKNQFHRSDRVGLRSTIGASVRFVVDMASPWDAVYSLAGGQSGWPKSPHFADRVADWHGGRQVKLTDEQTPRTTIRYLPANSN